MVEPKTILQGVNNELVSEIHFELGQVDWKTAYVKLTDNNVQKYSPPDLLVANAGAQ